MKQNRTASAHRVFEILWLAIIAISCVEIYLRWGTWTEVLAFFAFGILGIFRYAYSKRMRTRTKKSN